MEIDEHDLDDSFDEIYEGQRDSDSNPHGRGTLYFNSDKTERFEGHFKDGEKCGKGAFLFEDGSSLAGIFLDDCLQGTGKYTNEDGSYMCGDYINGELNGPSMHYDSDGRLNLRGVYKENMRVGIFHAYDKFGGHLFGVVDKLGAFTGNQIIYAYPDGETFLKGKFKDGLMVKAVEAVYDGKGDKNNPFSYKKKNSLVTYHYDPSTYDQISSAPLQPDPYEQKMCDVNKSTIPDAGEGLFSKVIAPENQIMSFYSGIRVPHAEVDARDWHFNNNTISLNSEVVIDVPLDLNSLSDYCASLGHKANHSFTPNSKYDKCEHPRFGKIKCIRTIKPVAPYEELTVEYGYDHSKLDTDAPQWYKDKLSEHQRITSHGA